MSFSEFTQEDYRLIDKAYGSLMEVARPRCRNEEEIQTVVKSFEFANQAHKNVRRRSGEPYMLHPIEVAKIVVSEIGLGFKSICAALLHDVVEDTDYTVEDIRNLFGDRIALLVDGLTKIKTVLDNEDRKGATVSTESLQAENFKRILLTLNDDVRVVLIKLADRLHNCRTIEFMPEHKRDKILSETMFIFIPLAHRLGLYGVKSEMENIWLKYKEPDAYREINERISKNIAARAKDIDDFIAPIEKALRDAGFRFTINESNGNSTTATTGTSPIELVAGSFKNFDSPLTIDTPQGWNIFGTIADNSYIELTGGHGTYFCSNVIASEGHNEFNIRYAEDESQIFGIGYGDVPPTNVPELTAYGLYQGQDGKLTLTPSETGYDIYFI